MKARLRILREPELAALQAALTRKVRGPFAQLLEEIHDDELTDQELAARAERVERKEAGGE